MQATHLLNQFFFLLLQVRVFREKITGFVALLKTIARLSNDERLSVRDRQRQPNPHYFLSINTPILYFPLPTLRRLYFSTQLIFSPSPDCIRPLSIILLFPLTKSNSTASSSPPSLDPTTEQGPLPSVPKHTQIIQFYMFRDNKYHFTLSCFSSSAIFFRCLESSVSSCTSFFTGLFLMVFALLAN